MLGSAPAHAARRPVPADQTDDGFTMFVSIVSGLATGGIIVALIECSTPFAHFVTRLFS